MSDKMRKQLLEALEFIFMLADKQKQIDCSREYALIKAALTQQPESTADAEIADLKRQLALAESHLEAYREVLGDGKQPESDRPWTELAACLYQACGAYGLPERILDALSLAQRGEPFGHLIDGLLPCCPQPSAQVPEIIKQLEEIIVDTPYPINPVITDPQGEAEYAALSAYRNCMMDQLRELGWGNPQSNYPNINAPSIAEKRELTTLSELRDTLHPGIVSRAGEEYVRQAAAEKREVPGFRSGRQRLFDLLESMTGFTCLEDDMSEIEQVVLSYASESKS